MEDNHKPTLLMIEDSPAEARLNAAHLRSEPYRIVHVETGQAGIDILAGDPPQLVLLDLNLPDMGGEEILEWISENGISTTVVVLTGNASLEVAVNTMRLGAFDFVVKPYNADRLKVTLRNAFERFQLGRLVKSYRDDFSGGQYCGFTGNSPAIQAVYRTIEAAASSKATIFITGESGTGKELCAEAIHKQSPRRDKLFLALNCAAIPRSLLESEMFGYVKGAFTDAISDREGAATRADGGTLFLDELCDMPVELQAKLLRFVQTGSFQKLGRPNTEQVDVRFICATNRDPRQEVKAGRMREDLFYRMHVIPISLPPLRERGTDTLMIAREMLARIAREENKNFKGFTEDAEGALASYSWPGNVRQLQNIIHRVVVLNDGRVVTRDMLPPPLNSQAPAPGGLIATPAVAVDAAYAAGAGTIAPLWRVEKEAITRALRQTNGNIPSAARMLEISPSTIYRKQQAWGAMDGNADEAAARTSDKPSPPSSAPGTAKDGIPYIN